MSTSNYDAVNCFWGHGAVDNPESIEMAKSWNWLKAQTGNTHPGACMPFGWVSALPYSGGYSSGYGINGCSGDGISPLISDRKNAVGITHFHTSGVGFMGYFYNYMLITPSVRGCDTSEPSILTGEIAQPGYYQATLDDYGTDIQLTCDKFAALHRFKFHADRGRIVIDANQAGLSSLPPGRDLDRIIWYDFRKSSPDKWSGFLHINGGIYLYFALRINADIADHKLFNGRLTIDVDGSSAETVLAFSLTSAADAEHRADAAANAGWDNVKAAAVKCWETLLNRVRADFASAHDREVFYSALYHSLVKPGDAGSEYIDFHTMWDIYRTQLPLMQALAPEYAVNMLRSMMKTIRRYGFFPNGYQMCTDYHCHDMQASGLVIYTLCDGFFRGLLSETDYPELKAVITAELSNADISERSHTHKLDLAGALFAASQVATLCGDRTFADTMLAKSNIWRKAYDPETGLMRADSVYYEGTLWNYSFRPHVNMAERVKLAGGTAGFNALLDEFFAVTGEYSLSEKRPVNDDHFEGMNNESDMETPYCYLWAGRSDRMAEVIDLCRRCRFTTGEGGCPGNNDSGGLSSWYVWSCLGIYPLTGTKFYLLGSPSVKSAEIDLPCGTLRIEVEKESDSSIYPAGYEFNGKAFAEPYIPVKELEAGGSLKFILRDRPVVPSVIPQWL